MRTTLIIDDDLMDELMRAEPDASRSEAVRRAIQEHLRRRRIDDFMKLAGSGLVDVDWREMERVETEDATRAERKARGRSR
jgi:metal-responsive CopG/Arc/MetJ family transcriptional regulator